MPTEQLTLTEKSRKYGAGSGRLYQMPKLRFPSSFSDDEKAEGRIAQKTELRRAEKGIMIFARFQARADTDHKTSGGDSETLPQSLHFFCRYLPERIASVDNHGHAVGGDAGFGQVLLCRAGNGNKPMRKQTLKRAVPLFFREPAEPRGRRERAMAGHQADGYPRKLARDTPRERGMGMQDLRAQATEHPGDFWNRAYIRAFIRATGKGGQSRLAAAKVRHVKRIKTRDQRTPPRQDHIRVIPGSVRMPEQIAKEHSCPADIGVADDVHNADPIHSLYSSRLFSGSDPVAFARWNRI